MIMISKILSLLNAISVTEVESSLCSKQHRLLTPIFRGWVRIDAGHFGARTIRRQNFAQRHSRNCLLYYFFFIIRKIKKIRKRRRNVRRRNGTAPSCPAPNRRRRNGDAEMALPLHYRPSIRASLMSRASIFSFDMEASSVQ